MFLLPHAEPHQCHQAEDAVVVLTYRCNSRCAMCHIWQSDQSGVGELTPSEYERALPHTLRYVNITGGEVFLRNDLAEVIGAVRRAAPLASVVISTNGMQPQRTQWMLPAILAANPDVGFAVSIDGDEITHDRIRGVNGAWRRARETIEVLRNANLRNIRLAFTASLTSAGSNVSQLGMVYDLSREMGVEFTCAIAHNSEHYFHIKSNRRVSPEELEPQLDRVARSELLAAEAKRWYRAYFYHGLLEHARAGTRPTPCEAAHTSFMLDPIGNVFPCNILNIPIGNVRQTEFQIIWESSVMQTARKIVRNCDRPCWMVCTARASIQRDHELVMSWIEESKKRAHLGLPVLAAIATPDKVS